MGNSDKGSSQRKSSGGLLGVKKQKAMKEEDRQPLGGTSLSKRWGRENESDAWE